MDQFWLNEMRTFHDSMNDYRKQNKLTDVELEVSGKLFPAHRLVLSLNSPVLAAAFSENWTQSKIYPLSDEHVDVEIMEDLLNFFYTGNIDLTSENAYPVCVVAHFLQVQNLLELCVDFLNDTISVENVFTLFVFSLSRSLNTLRDSCLNFISIDHEKMLQNPHIFQFSSNDFSDLIVGLENLGEFLIGTSLREHTFECVIRWVEANVSERLNELPVLLENIPIEEVSYRFLTQTVFKHPLVKESFPCIQKLLETINIPSFEAVLKSELYRSNQELIVIGGQKSGDKLSSVMNYYHALSQTWRKLPDMLQSRRQFAMTVMNQRDIIVCGGVVERFDCSETTGSVEMFSWDTHSWQQLPDMPIAVTSPSIAVHKDYLYVSGREQRDLEGDTIWQYSFEKRQWKYVEPMIPFRSDGCLVSYKDHLYVIGGDSEFVERYDSARDEWEMMADMKLTSFFLVGMNCTMACTHQDKIYVLRLGKLEAYDPQANTWTSLPAPTIEDSTSLVSLNGKLLIVGNSIQEFDLSTQQWKKFDEIPLNSIPHHAIVGDYY